MEVNVEHVKEIITKARKSGDTRCVNIMTYRKIKWSKEKEETKMYFDQDAQICCTQKDVWLAFKKFFITKKEEKPNEYDKNDHFDWAEDVQGKDFPRVHYDYILNRILYY